MSTAANEARAAAPRASDHALRKRAEKKATAEEIGIDAAYIDRFVESFYEKVQRDDLLGPVFSARITDWRTHLVRMKAFWRSVLHNSGEFAGNPMIKHIAIPGIGFEHFSHWLELFYETLREGEPTCEATTLVGSRARMIADSLLTGILLQRNGLSGGRAGTDLPHV